MTDHPTTQPTTTPKADDFFAPLSNTKPFLKLAFEGFAGCGKTFTMAILAAGLHKRIASTKPIIIFDTEHAAKFLARFFAEAGVPVLHKESRSLDDLRETMRRCRDGASDILLIDSITHVWENFLAAYMKRKNRTRLQFEDWGVLKPTWKDIFSTPFVRDPYHALMTGRAGYEYEDEKDEDGKRQIYKSGIKMKVEGETAYEPDILVLMSRMQEVLGDDKRVWREAMIIKDRSDLIDGRTFKNPTYKDFEPAIEALLTNPAARKVSTREGNDADLVKDEEGKREYVKSRDIAVEKLEAAVIELGLSGTGAEAKRAKLEAFKAAFGTVSWTEILGMGPDMIALGTAALAKFVESKREAAAHAEAS